MIELVILLLVIFALFGGIGISPWLFLILLVVLLLAGGSWGAPTGPWYRRGRRWY